MIPSTAKLVQPGQAVGRFLAAVLRWATPLLGMCFVCYLSSQLLDRGIVKRIGWLILWDTSWKPAYSSNLEEALETLGGLFLLCTPFAVKVSRAANLARPKTNPYK